MQNKIFLSAIFIVMILLQWFVPFKMLWDRENILRNGDQFLFECAPVDPKDPFRGKYITLNFKENQIVIPNYDNYTSGESIYVHLDNNDRGYAKLRSISKEKPDDMHQILKADVGWRSWNNEEKTRTIKINYPFTRFYMEESKAKPAEDLYRKIGRDTSSTTYAVVMIKDGVGVIKDVMIDGVPIATIVENKSNE